VKPSAVKHPGTIWSLALSPDHNHLLTTGVEGTARLWSVGREEKLLRELAHNGQVRAGVFSSSGKVLATASFDRTARLWSVPSGEPLRSFPHPGMVEDVAFSPDGTLVATACGDGGARLWSVSTGQRVGPVLKHHGSVLTVKFSPNGTGLATGGRDRTVRFWEVPTGRPGSVLEHGGWVEDLLFASEGRSLVTADVEGGIRWWDVATGEVLGPPLEQSGGYWHLALSGDGRRIAAGSHVLPLTIWTVPTPVPSFVANAELWVEVLTWHEMDPNGALRPLDRATWLARRAQLEQHGGALEVRREQP
jgi:WD40 repeat protein